MHFKIPIASLMFAFANAAYISTPHSFGHGQGKITDTPGHIPGWHLAGVPQTPECLSNKVILTQPYGANHRGSIWTNRVLEHAAWKVEVDFRATGSERGGGNLQIWYVRNGEQDIAQSSIYTAGKFDGLGIVIDQYAGSGGFVRGFLNDGTKKYNDHHAVDSLAFGHCQHAYRNLGHPTRLVIQQTEDNFKVSLDNKICFQSSTIKLPIGYSLGISAASASEPDSFEVFKFVTYTDKLHPEIHGIEDPPTPPPEEGEHYPTFIGQKTQKSAKDEHVPEHEFVEQKWTDTPDQDASKIETSAQFADLHNRLQGLTRHLITTSRDLVHYQNLAAERHNLILDLLHKLETSTAPIPGIQGAMTRYENMERKMDSIAADVRQTKTDLHSSLEQHVSGLRHEVRANHGSMMGAVYSGAIGFGKFAIVIVGSQVITIGAYLIYKKRKGGQRQKYL